MIDWKPISTVPKSSKAWSLLKSNETTIVKGHFAYTHDKDYIAYMLINGGTATTTIENFIEWAEIPKELTE